MRDSPLRPRRSALDFILRFALSLPLAGTLLAVACAPVTQAPDVDPVLTKAEAEKQRQIVFDRQLSEMRRLHYVAFRTFSANADLCRDKGKIAKNLGVHLTNADAFPRDYKTVAEKSLGSGGVLQVVAVAPGSPAERVGMREGDAVLALNGTPTPTGKSAAKKIGEQLAELAKKGAPVEFRIRREDFERNLLVNFADACDYAFGVVQNSAVNAFADGKSIRVTSGMMRLASTDEELATVVGHELAHNLMEHIDSKRGNAALGLLVDILFTGVGVNTQGAFSNMAGESYSQEFETEADYVGLYLMARAGYDIAGSPNFWRRMGVEHPGSIRTNHAASHPSAPYRFVSLDKTVEEINRKKTSGLPLQPEMKKAETGQAAAPTGN